MAVTLRIVVLLAALAGALAPAARAQGGAPVTQRGTDVSINFVDADLRSVIQTLSPYLDRPVVVSGVGPVRVTLQTPGLVPRAQVAALLRTTIEANNYEMAQDGGTYVVRPRAAQPGPPGGFAQQPVQPQPGPRAQGGVQLFVIRLRHAKAADVAAVVNALYGRASALGELGSTRPSTLGSDLTRNQLPPYNPNQPAQAGPTAVVTGRDATLASETSIVPESRTNSLLIRATPGDFELIQAAVQQIDIRPLQVLVEVVIAEVQRNSGFALGLFAGADDIHARGDVTGSVSLNDSLSLPGNGLILRALNIGHYQFNVTLAAAANRGDVTILSRPVLFAANNEAANLSVGRQVPFVQATTRTDAGIPTDLVQYRDVSTQLHIVPTISPDGYVLLDVSQEVNSVENGSGVKSNPIISTRSLQTQLLVRDGQTGVLGGLSDQQRTVTRNGIPVLSSIPIVGGLFGGRTRDTRDAELFIFLTPRIVRDDAEMDQTTDDVRNNSRRLQGPLQNARPYVAPAPPAGQLRPKPGEGEP